MGCVLTERATGCWVGQRELEGHPASQLGWKNWEVGGQFWGKSTSCMDQCSCPKCWGLISMTAVVCQGQMLD